MEHRTGTVFKVHHSVQYTVIRTVHGVQSARCTVSSVYSELLNEKELNSKHVPQT